MISTRWTRGGLFLSALIFAGIAFAQGGPVPRRTETGDPPIPELAGGGEPWTVVRITGQVPGSALGSLAVDAAGGVFVWSLRREIVPIAAGADDPIARRTEPGDPIHPEQVGGPPPLLPMGEGGAAPTPRRADSGDVPTYEGGGADPVVPMERITLSTLYRWDGVAWTASLQLRGESGASVFIARSGDIFAATDLPNGTVRVYRFHAGTWRLEGLPENVRGPAGAMAGENVIYFRAGDSVLRHHGNHWRVEFSCADLDVTGGLVYIDRNQILVPCGEDEHVFNGRRWIMNMAPKTTHVHGAWGGRDEQGALHLFASGCNAAHTGSRVFEFVESQPGRLIGAYQVSAQDPVVGQGKLGSFASRVWGSRVHDIYVTGVVDGVGRLYHFDGQSWRNLEPMANMPAANDVGGTASGELWVSLADGRLLHRLDTAAAARSRAPEPKPLRNANDTARIATAPAGGFLVRGGPAGVATLEFALPDERQVSLVVFDLAGRRVETLERNRLGAGAHQVSWNASHVPSGIYFLRLEAGALKATQKILIHR